MKISRKWQMKKSSIPEHRHLQRLVSIIAKNRGKIKYKYQTVQIKISSPKLIRTGIKVPIQIHSTNKNELIQPNKWIKELFRPKIMMIQHMYKNFFDRESLHYNSDVMDQLEFQYKFRVHFSYNRVNSTLYIYCPVQIENDIKTKITKILKKIQIAQKIFCIKNKTLSTVQGMLKMLQIQHYSTQHKNKINSHFSYQIDYSNKSIAVQAKLQILDKITLLMSDIGQKQLMMEQKIDQSSTNSYICSICCQINQQYCLFNCQHIFCVKCLINYIKQYSSKNQPVVCPDAQNCKKPINVIDIKRILAEKQFQKFCDLKIQSYVEESNKYHGCFTPDCDQIFEKSVSEQKMRFQCDLCGVQYCMKCQSSHTSQVCPNVMDEYTLKKLGIKKCPNCKIPFQKNRGCNHIQCRGCKQHYCWVCLAIYKTQKQCTNHIIQNDGSLFSSMQDLVYEQNIFEQNFDDDFNNDDDFDDGFHPDMDQQFWGDSD